MATKLYVGGLPYAVTDDELQQIFAAHGSVTSAKVITDRETGRSKGFGFVEFDNDEEATKAIETMNDTELQGRKIVVSIARPMERREGGGGGGGFRRDF